MAGFQALARNLTRFDVPWANEMLTDMDWADSLLRKGTLWLAFLGASLATHRHKHIGIDILLRIAPAKAKYVMTAMSSVLAGVIAVGLTASFSQAVYLNLTERPIEYELLGDDGESLHVCDATDAQMDALEGVERPPFFCILRAGLATIGIPAMNLDFVGAFDPAIPRAELTGTADGRLFAFWPNRGSGGTGANVAEIDKRTAGVIARTELPIARATDAFAFAFWGGDFWIFTGSRQASAVVRFRPSDGTTVQLGTHAGTIVGAGVSTCAPQE
jgi:hypothetical protein